MTNNDGIARVWFGPITKVEKDGDARIVWGKATDETLDSDLQIINGKWAAKAMAKWFTTGANVRQQHATTLPPAGKGIELVSQDDGEWLRSRIVEPVAVRLLDEQVYQGYSVGVSQPHISRSNKARNGEIDAGEIVEVSIVDRPANPSAVLSVVKMAQDGTAEFVGKVVAPDTTKVGRIFSGANEAELRAVVTTIETLLAQLGDGEDMQSQEDSVTDATQPGAEVLTPSAEKSVKCDKCGGTGFTDGKCDKCGAAMPAIKGADLGDLTEDVQDLVEDAQQLAEDAGDVSGEDKAAKADEPPEKEPPAEEKKPAFEGAAPAFKKPKKAKKIAEPESVEAPEPAAAVEKAADKPAPDPNVGGGAVREDIPDADYVFPEDKPDGGFPIVKPGDVSDAVNSWGRYKGPHSFDDFKKRLTSIATRMGPSFVTELPANWKDEKKPKKSKKVRKIEKRARSEAVKQAAELPWAIRQAHDAACPAYDSAALKEAYPTLEKNGVAAALGPMAQSALFAMLSNEVQEDGGSGVEALECHKLAKAYHALVAVLELEAGQDMEAVSGVYMAAHDHLHAAFKQANSIDDPAVSPLPKPSDPPSPGQFHRPYIQAGRAAETAVTHDVAVTRPGKPIEAGDFNRQALGPSEGRERSFADKLMKFHDAMASWRPGLCRMGATSSGPHRDLPASFYAPDITGNAGLTSQPAGNFARPPETQHLDTRAGSLPTPVRMTLPPSAPIPGGLKGAVAPRAEAVITQEGDIEAALRELAAQVNQQNAAFTTKIASIETLTEQLASSGDPAQRAVRGAAGFLSKAATVSTSRVQREAARTEKQERQRREDIAWYEGKARAGGPDERAAAIRKLAKLGVEFDDQ